LNGYSRPYIEPAAAAVAAVAEPDRWAKHNVRLHYTGTKTFHHPVVGDIDVTYETMPLPADPGLVLTI
jgi:MmyB-like transcription regulator ligand binding domain